jgi:hypothetical protein
VFSPDLFYTGVILIKQIRGEHRGDSDKTNQRREHRGDSEKTNQRSEHRCDSDKTNQRRTQG